MDPESGLDAVRNVGIKDGKIATVMKSAIKGKETISAKGQVVAPGFRSLSITNCNRYKILHPKTIDYDK